MTIMKLHFYRLAAYMAMLMLPLNSLYAQSDIPGKVTDVYGNPIKDVEIRIENNLAGQTNEAGRFSLSVNDGDLLVFQSEGYLSEEFTWTGGDKAVITLKKDFFKQNRSVAYGIQGNYSQTAAISTVSGDDLAGIPTQVMSNGLDGKLSGLTVLHSSGEPGENIPLMLIRGKSTFVDNSYLVFVDGFEAEMDQLIPAEIETISILKDAASLATFGIRGANGVIWVTTKRGQSTNMQVNLESRVGLSQKFS